MLITGKPGLSTIFVPTETSGNHRSWICYRPDAQPTVKNADSNQILIQHSQFRLQFTRHTVTNSNICNMH